MGKSSKNPKVDIAPVSTSPTKKVKKAKRGSNETPGQSTVSKKVEMEVQQVIQPKEKDRKVKSTLNESPWKKKKEIKGLIFEDVTTPIMVSPTKAAKKAKWGGGDMPEIQRRPKKQKVEADKAGSYNKTMNKLKKALVEPIRNKKDETSRSDFEEVDAGNMSGTLIGDAKNLKTSKTFKDEPKAPTNRGEESDAKRLFVGNLSSEVTRDDLLEFFRKAGEVTEIRLAATEDGSFRGFGHVEFASAADAHRALGMKYELLLGRRMMIDLAVEIGSIKPPKGKGMRHSAHCVYVKGFTKSLEEDQIRSLLKEHFRSCGEIIGMSIPRDHKTGHSKGFAFLVFNNQVTVSKALQLSGTELGNFTLTVKQSAPNSHALDGSSRGGRGGRGRSTNQGGGRGELSRGRGRDSWGPGAPYKSSASIESKAKKKTFEDAD